MRAGTLPGAALESTIHGGVLRLIQRVLPMMLFRLATAMLVAPLSMVAHRAGEIVRLITGLLQ